MTRRASFSAGKTERGYVLLTLLLMVALIIVALAAVLPAISFEIRRDREQELIHRGVQYSRAIRGYYKKFGRYPTRLEELENTNNLRFLRKRYKDPVTGQDFKLLHFGEVKMTFGAPLAGATGINGANSLNGGSLNGGNSLNGPGAFGSQPGGMAGGGAFGAQPSGFAAATKDTSTPSSTPSTTDPNQNQTAGSNSPSSSSTTPGDPSGQQPGSASGDKLSGQVFGGGPVVGVVSKSKKDSIREFNHKKKYDEWQFIYDPSSDRGGLLSTPNQPPLQGFGNQPGQALQPGGVGGVGSSPFGQTPGMGSNPTANPVAPAYPTPQPTNPPQQQ
jgi:type II secretory pathway pseudopilin PulG